MQLFNYHKLPSMSVKQSSPNPPSKSSSETLGHIVRYIRAVFQLCIIRTPTKLRLYRDNVILCALTSVKTR